MYNKGKVCLCGCANFYNTNKRQFFFNFWRKVFVHLVTYATMNSWLLIAQPTKLLTHRFPKNVASFIRMYIVLPWTVPSDWPLTDSFCLFQSQRWSTVFYSWPPFLGLPMLQSPTMTIVATIVQVPFWIIGLIVSWPKFRSLDDLVKS